MTFIPRVRPKPQKSVYKERSVPAFRRWVKKLQCSVKGCQNGNIDPAHIRCDLPADAIRGGTSLKPHDAWIIPLCRDHHNEQGAGERTFAAKYKLEEVTLAASLWDIWLRTTEPGQRWKRDNA
jgi:hypothetical protein